MSIIDLSNITAENVHTLCDEERINHFLLCSLSDEELNINYNATISKAREFNIESEVTAAYKKALKKNHPDYKLPIAAKNMADVQSTHAEWLWYPYIPKGKITLMTADPGTGKTFFCLYLCSCVSNGVPFLGEDKSKKRQEAIAIYQTAEDGIADTIKPRLETMKPPPNFANILNIPEEDEQLTLKDTATIESVMKQFNPDLIIFDPLQAYLGADVDMHRANEVRPVLSAIGHLAEKYHCSVILIMHNSKMGQNKALYRGLGSIDIPAVARSMLILGNHPDMPNLKVFCHEKSSLAPHGQSILFEIDTKRGGIVFDNFSALKADDILNVKKGSRDKPSVTKDEATDELLELLGEKGYAKLEDIQAMQEYIGCSRPTLYRAKQDLVLDTVSMGYSKNKVTYWLAPDVDKEKFKEEHRPTQNKIT